MGKKQIMVLLVIVTIYAINLQKQDKNIDHPILQVDVHKCIQENCPNELAACDATCKKILSNGQTKCGTYSDPRNISCWTFFLIGQKNEEAIKVAQCAQKNLCFTDAQTAKVEFLPILQADVHKCLQKYCVSEFTACDDICQKILSDGENKCGTYSDARNISCWTFYLVGQKNQEAISIAQCGQRNRCFTDTFPLIKILANQQFQTFATQNCPDQLITCVNDPKCLSILSVCSRKCISNHSCLHNCLHNRRQQTVVELFACISKDRSQDF